MVGLKWRRIKKYIREHPYLVDKDYKLSMAEAQKVIDNGEPLSFEEMIRSAAKRSSIPMHIWEEAVPALTRHKNTVKNERVRKRRFVIACIVAFIILFFTVTPTGQTLAKKAIDWVISVFDNMFVVENANDPNIENNVYIDTAPPEPPQIGGNNEFEERYFDSFSEFNDAIGLRPIVLDTSKAIPKEILYIPDAAGGQMLTVIYDSEQYGEIVTSQIWSDGEAVSINFGKDYEVWHVLNEKHEMFCRVNDKDNTFEGNLVLDNGVFTIGFENNENPKDILSNLKQYDNL